MTASSDPLFELIAYDPIAVPHSSDELAALEAQFAAAWQVSTSPAATVLAVEGVPYDEQRRWIRDAAFELEARGRIWATLADLHRRSEAGTLGAYNGFSFDRSRGVVGLIAGWE